MQWLSAAYPLILPTLTYTAWHLALLQQALVQLLGQRRLLRVRVRVRIRVRAIGLGLGLGSGFRVRVRVS